MISSESTWPSWKPSTDARKAVACFARASRPGAGGSNGIAIAPSNTVQHHALLLINPHTSFFFRSELQMVSEQGLDAYGAVTWGQFFIYQGFNPRLGWMHTSSGVDAVDEYLETVSSKDGHYSYKYGDGERPVIEKQITVPYITPQGMAEKKFTAYYTHHGPVIREQDGKWVTIRLMQEPVKALMQSYSRTKAKTYQEYLQTMQLQANSSNNTVYADADGHIAYFHGNFIPRRDRSLRLHQAGGWKRPGDRVAGPAHRRGVAPSAGSQKRLSLQRERFTLERRRRKQLAQAGLPCLR